MPRTARASCADICYHVMNRGNARATVFHDRSDYNAFVALLRRANQRIPMRILAWCVMPNHFHLVLRPYKDLDLGRWMHWLLTAHVRRHQSRHGTIGRIWQGRFKALPVQEDAHLLAVLRYVERNPLRAGLVQRAEEWRWSSMQWRSSTSGLLSMPPIQLPENWGAFVNRSQGDDLDSIRRAIQRGRPFGDPQWSEQTAERLGITNSLRPLGRPVSNAAGRVPTAGRTSPVEKRNVPISSPLKNEECPLFRDGGGGAAVD